MITLLFKVFKFAYNFFELADTLASAIVDDPPNILRDGGFIRVGFNQDLDDLIKLSTDSRAWIINLEQKEREETGISSLKVRHNKVFWLLH